MGHSKRGLWSKLGQGLIGLIAYVVRAQHQARAYGLESMPVPALLTHYLSGLVMLEPTLTLVLALGSLVATQIFRS